MNQNTKHCHSWNFNFAKHLTILTETVIQGYKNMVLLYVVFIAFLGWKI